MTTTSTTEEEFLACDNCDTLLGPPDKSSGRRFHTNGTYACPPFDDEGASISRTVASPQPPDAKPPSVRDGTLDVASAEGQSQLREGWHG
jgi:hypothetical protein